MWGDDARIAELTAKVAAQAAALSALDLALEREKSARLADRLETLGRLETFHEDLASAIAGVKPRDKQVRAFRNARDFRAEVEKEEGVA